MNPDVSLPTFFADLLGPVGEVARVGGGVPEGLPGALTGLSDVRLDGDQSVADAPSRHAQQTLLQDERVGPVPLDARGQVCGVASGRILP